MFTLGNKLNRSYTIHIPFADSYCEISIMFNKANSFIGFNLDQHNYIKSRNGEIHSSIYQDLDRSEFAVSFLDIRNVRSQNLDIKRQFHNILPSYADKIHYETNETLKLSKVQTQKGNCFESCLYVYVFRYTDFENNFVYCLAERHHIDVILDKKIVRTCAIQLATNEVYEDIAKLVESVNRKYIEDATVEKTIGDVFSTKKNINMDLEM